MSWGFKLFVLSIAGTANNVVLALFIKMLLGQKDDNESREKVIQQRIFVLVGWALALLLAQVDSNPIAMSSDLMTLTTW